MPGLLEFKLCSVNLKPAFLKRKPGSLKLEPASLKIEPGSLTRDWPPGPQKFLARLGGRAGARQQFLGPLSPGAPICIL